MLDRFPTLLAASTFLVLLLSVTHEWGYFSIIGAHFQTLLSPYDYLANTLLWLPYIFIAFFLLSVLKLVELRAADFQFPPVAGLENKFMHFVGWSFIALAIISFLFLPPRDTALPYLMAFYYIWPLFCGYVLIHERLKSTVTFGGFVLAVFVPMLVGGAYVTGLSEAYNDLNKSSPFYLLQPSKDAPMRPVIILRNFEKGILVRGENKQVEFQKWSDIASLAHNSPEPSDVSHACRRFGILCDWRKTTK